MVEPQPLLLILPEQSDWSKENALPIKKDNLFQRIIRNPHIESAKPKERECTEMLCAVLRNTKELRLHLLEWLAELAGQSVPDLEDLDFEINTEQDIEGKRADLQIEGSRSSEDGQELVVLWIIEVKVGAGFHFGPRLDLSESGEDEVQAEELHEEEEENKELVNQIVNYDGWLNDQSASHRAGFVLAIDNKTAKLPKGLKCCWACFTWTKLGLQVKAALDKKNIPADETLLARHMLGFIKDNLWSAQEMPDEPITFDDIALLRAFSQIGVNCEKKVNQLVGQLDDLLKESGVGCGRIDSKQNLYQKYVISIVQRQLFDSTPYPLLMLGVCEDNLAIWLQTAPTNVNKTEVTRAVASVKKSMEQRNPDWKVPEKEERWWDIYMQKALSTLLNVHDQDAAFKEFFRKALDDIKSAGLVQAIEKALKRK